MTVMSAGNGNKLIHLLKTNGFLQTVAESGMTVFGPGITLLRENIFRMWVDRVIVRAESSYPVEGHHSFAPLEYFPEVFKMINKQVPFSIACTTRRPAGSNQPELLRLLHNFKEEKSLTFLHFCPQSSVNTTFDQVVNERQTWWKQFSHNSSDITLDNMEHVDGIQTGRCLQYKFPWGTETIETVCLMGEEHLKTLEKRTNTQCKYNLKNKSLWPSHIQAETSLEMCTAVYLKDAFVEKQDRQVLHLHPALAPYKGAICRDGTRHQAINELSTYVSATLRKEGIKIIDMRENEVPLQDQFARYDEMGIPFCVVVSDEMIETGTVKVRNRDTAILETLAMGKLPVYLSKQVTYQPDS